MRFDLNADAILKQSGVRATPARLATLGALLATSHALTHHEIEEAVAVAGEQINRITLYRTLDFLMDKKLVHRISGVDRAWRYEVRNAPNGQQRPHFRCNDCGMVVSLRTINPAIAVGLPDGYVFEEAELIIRGKCPNCS